MSSIIKLSILGVRAFDNHDRELIAFGKPLTLISGPNGVGKTTIIECLRYATTGDLPPNSKGGAFVHDPKMSGEREVLAQVKLSFYSASGVQMVCTRSMQLTVKKNTQTFKTLEGQLLAYSGDQKHTVSSRCADLDVQIPHSLGVSPAVLNYVIFCHQEDSLWPLAEPSIVKKRFDDIFEATKFTKALDNLKTLRKDYSAEIKVQEKTAQYLQADEERATKIRARIVELKGDVESYEDECSALKEKIESATIHLNHLFETTRGFQQRSNELDQMRRNSAALQSSIESLLEGLEVLDSSTTEIEQELSSFDSNEESLQNELAALQKRKAAQGAKIQELREAQSKLTLRKGKLEAEFEQFNQRRDQLNELKAQAIDLFGDFDGTLTEKLSDIVSEANDAYERAKTDHRQNENSIQSEINRITATKLRLEQEKQSKELKLQELNSLRNQMAKEIEDHESSNSRQSVNHHLSLLKEYKDKLLAVQEKQAKFAAENTVQEAQKQVFMLQAEVESSNRALTRATNLFSEQSKLMVLKDESERKLNQVQSSEAALKTEFENLLGLKFDRATFEKDYTTVKDSSVSELEGRQNEHQEHSEAMKVTKSKLERAQKECETLEAQAQSLRQQIQTRTQEDILSFDESLKEAEEDLQVSTQNMEQSSFTSQYYEAAKANANSSGCCLLCQRSLNQKEQNLFVEFLEEKLASMPLTKEEAVAMLDTATTRVQTLRALAPQVNRLRTIEKEELPESQRLMKELQNDLKSDTSRYDESGKRVAEVKEHVTALSSIQRQVSELSQRVHELHLVQAEIRSLSESSMVEDAETPQQVQARVSELTQKYRDQQQKLQDLKDEENLIKEEISRWNNMINKKQLELKNIELEEQGVKLKHAKLEDVISREAEIKESVPALREQLTETVAQLEVVEINLREEKVKSASLEKSLATALSDAQSRYNECNVLVDLIDKFVLAHGENPLAAITQESAQLEQSLTSELAGIDQLDNELQNLDRRITDFRGQKRILHDNLQLRRSRQELTTLEDTVSSLEQELAEFDRQEYERQTLELQDECSNLNSSYSSKLGEIKQMQDQVSRLESELATDYATVQDDYRRASVKLESTVVATDDIGKYLKALDAAIMQYHSVKMREINQVLDELWKKTYKGTDVDTIMIKGESEGKGARTYNYRVCMVKQDTELDMRGRCSAGQKVLASVIIRLALSECFGVNCGLIVLDEPTTNLDRANSESLARSLATIIETRRVQRNFQLIVISHDEHFLSCMNAAEYCDHFYRIDRDMRQMSRIERLPIGMLQ